MESSNREEIRALGASLQLLGRQIEAGQKTLKELESRGIPLSSPEIVEASRPFHFACITFAWQQSRLFKLLLDMEARGELAETEGSSPRLSRLFQQLKEVKAQIDGNEVLQQFFHTFNAFNEPEPN